MVIYIGAVTSSDKRVSSSGDSDWDPLEDGDQSGERPNEPQGRGLMHKAFRHPLMRMRGMARGRARGGALNRSLDLVNESIFNPGGSKDPIQGQKNVTFESVEATQQLEQQRRTLDQLKIEAQQWQNVLTDLETESSDKRLLLETARATLWEKGEQLEYTKETLEEHERALKTANAEFLQLNTDMNHLVQARDSQVRDNEDVRQGIIAETTHMNKKREKLINDVANLTAKKSLLDTYLNRAQTEVDTSDSEKDSNDLSSITSSQTNPSANTIPDDPYGIQTPLYVNATCKVGPRAVLKNDGSPELIGPVSDGKSGDMIRTPVVRGISENPKSNEGPTLVAGLGTTAIVNNTSTAKKATVNPARVRYDPFINDNGKRHVTQGVYNASQSNMGSEIPKGRGVTIQVDPKPVASNVTSASSVPQRAPVVVTCAGGQVKTGVPTVTQGSRTQTVTSTTCPGPEVTSNATRRTVVNSSTTVTSTNRAPVMSTNQANGSNTASSNQGHGNQGNPNLNQYGHGSQYAYQSQGNAYGNQYQQPAQHNPYAQQYGPPPNMMNTSVGSNTSSAAPNVPKGPTRRASMSPDMVKLYDANPAIAGLGLDTISRRSDGIDTVEWSVQQALNLAVPAQNSARRIAYSPKFYEGRISWRDWLKGFMDDMRCNGWNQEDALPQLCRCLRGGPGQAALDRWEEKCGPNGTFVQLVQCASYVLGSIGAENPKVAFKKRTQKPGESPKMYGLALQSLLQKVHPRLEFDDEYFMNDLFTQFVEGLRDADMQAVVYDSWRADSSLNDLFMAIDMHSTKKSLMAGRIPNQSRISAFLGEVPVDEGQFEEAEECNVENIGAARFQNRQGGNSGGYQGRTFGGNQVSNSGGYQNGNFGGNQGGYTRRDGEPNRDYVRKPQEVVNTKEPQKVVEKVVAKESKETTPSAEMMETIVKQLKESLGIGKRRERREPVDKSTRSCYRCTVVGHYARDCPAEKPVYKSKEPPAAN